MTLVVWEAVLLYSLTLISFASSTTLVANSTTLVANSTTLVANSTTLVANSTTLVANLSQNETNGDSQLGTPSAPTLPQFLTNNPLPQGFPWGSKTASNSNPYEQSPTTGVIRTYNFVIERGFLAPDGVNKSVIMINGQIPGPKIEANWGDTIQVTVTNNITGPEEGTSLHWHGLLQTETPWFDGVPSVQQCPIAPSSTFTYSFKAGLYGTSWYHSHYSAQYADGLSGPMIIYGPPNAEYDIDLGPVFLTDLYHEPYFSIVESQEAQNLSPTTRLYSDNNLINGKGNFSCSQAPAGTDCVPNAGLSVFNFQSGQIHLLRLINAGAEALQRFTIDGYEMTIIANDFVPVEPYPAEMITLGVGQRSDILITAIGDPTDAVWMRSDISGACSSSHQPHALAAIYYESADTTQQPTTTATPYNDSHCGNDPLDKTVPYYPYSPLSPPATTKEIDITFRANETGYLQWYMNNQTFRANYDNPILLLANQGNTSYPPESNVYNFGSNSSIRIVLYNHVPFVSHPMHLHGHNFWVVAEGVGQWNGTANTINPQRRDTQLIQPAVGSQPGYLVLEFNTDNPGVWPFHCHIAWHVSSGLYVNILERPDDITETEIPSIMPQTCTDWANYSGHNVVDQIDSGL